MAAEESTVAFATVKSCSLQKNAMETPFDMIFALATSKNVCFMLDFRGVLFGHGDFFSPQRNHRPQSRKRMLHM